MSKEAACGTMFPGRSGRVGEIGLPYKQFPLYFTDFLNLYIMYLYLLQFSKNLEKMSSWNLQLGTISLGQSGLRFKISQSIAEILGWRACRA